MPSHHRPMCSAGLFLSFPVAAKVVPCVGPFDATHGGDGCVDELDTAVQANSETFIGYRETSADSEKW